MGQSERGLMGQDGSTCEALEEQPAADQSGHDRPGMFHEAAETWSGQLDEAVSAALLRLLHSACQSHSSTTVPLGPASAQPTHDQAADYDPQHGLRTNFAAYVEQDPSKISGETALELCLLLEHVVCTRSALTALTALG